MCAGIYILTVISGNADAIHTKMTLGGKLKLTMTFIPWLKGKWIPKQSQWGQASPTKIIEWPARPESYHPTEER